MTSPLNTATLEAPAELAAEFAALQALAARHRREYMRLRTAQLAALTGQPVRFSRHRMTQAELAQLPPVTDSNGTELRPGMKVRTPDGVRAVVQRVDRRSRRCVVERTDGTVKMTVASRLTAFARRPKAATAA